DVVVALRFRSPRQQECLPERFSRASVFAIHDCVEVQNEGAERGQRLVVVAGFADELRFLALDAIGLSQAAHAFQEQVSPTKEFQPSLFVAPVSRSPVLPLLAGRKRGQRPGKRPSWTRWLETLEPVSQGFTQIGIR